MALIFIAKRGVLGSTFRLCFYLGLSAGILGGRVLVQDIGVKR